MEAAASPQGRGLGGLARPGGRGVGGGGGRGWGGGGGGGEGMDTSQQLEFG